MMCYTGLEGCHSRMIANNFFYLITIKTDFSTIRFFDTELFRMDIFIIYSIDICSRCIEFCSMNFICPNFIEVSLYCSYPKCNKVSYDMYILNKKFCYPKKLFLYMLCSIEGIIKLSIVNQK